jgi:2-polyprenyl-3-methyl-5-hydroxy-6-metoxy-1,4-benzoquinol methylase
LQSSATRRDGGAVSSNRATPPEAMIDRLRRAASGTFEISAMVIGLRLGLYKALHVGGPATSAELAARTGTAERPVREWLEHGAVNGHLELEADSDDPTARRFSLPPAHAEALLDMDSLNYAGTMAIQVIAAVNSLPRVIESFRTGEGFAYGASGDDMRVSEGDANRPAYLGPLGREWLPSIADVHARLMAEPPARIADIGCGLGWSSIGMALAYPKVSVDALDLDAPSIEMARNNAAEAEVNDRIRFGVADAASTGLTGDYDLITLFEAFHDMAHPVAILSELARLLRADGSIVIADTRTSEHFDAPGDAMECYHYGWSVMQCLHSGLQGGGAGTGTVMRPETLRRFAEAAGLGRVDVLPIEHDSWRFYRLRPQPAPQRNGEGP